MKKFLLESLLRTDHGRLIDMGFLDDLKELKARTERGDLDALQEFFDIYRFDANVEGLGFSPTAPWVEAPTGAGFYWLRRDGNAPEMVEVRQFGPPERPHLCIYGFGWGGHDVAHLPEFFPAWRFQGPLRPVGGEKIA